MVVLVAEGVQPALPVFVPPRLAAQLQSAVQAAVEPLDLTLRLRMSVAVEAQLDALFHQPHAEPRPAGSLPLLVHIHLVPGHSPSFSAVYDVLITNCLPCHQIEHLGTCATTAVVYFRSGLERWLSDVVAQTPTSAASTLVLTPRLPVAIGGRKSASSSCRKKKRRFANKQECSSHRANKQGCLGYRLANKQDCLSYRANEQECLSHHSEQ